MDIYTVSFFGHREVDNYWQAESRLEEIVTKLIKGKEFVEFLVGKNGEFDMLATSVVKRAQKRYGKHNSSLTLVLAYQSAEFTKNREYFEAFYDTVEICPASESAHFKAAIQVRNRDMVSRSDLVVFYVGRKSGGAYQTYDWALKSGKAVINIEEMQ